MQIGMFLGLHIEHLCLSVDSSTSMFDSVILHYAVSGLGFWAPQTSGLVYVPRAQPRVGLAYSLLLLSVSLRLLGLLDLEYLDLRLHTPSTQALCETHVFCKKHVTARVHAKTPQN